MPRSGLPAVAPHRAAQDLTAARVRAGGINGRQGTRCCGRAGGRPPVGGRAGRTRDARDRVRGRDGWTPTWHAV